MRKASDEFCNALQVYNFIKWLVKKYPELYEPCRSSVISWAAELQREYLIKLSKSNLIEGIKNKTLGYVSPLNNISLDDILEEFLFEFDCLLVTELENNIPNLVNHIYRYKDETYP